MAAWWGLGGLSVWMLFVPITFTSIGDGLSQPAAMASALSTYPRLAGTASGLMGCAQMATAAVGTIAVAALPHDSALGLIAVVGFFIAAAFVCGIVGVMRSAVAPTRSSSRPRQGGAIFVTASEHPPEKL
jgi:DHA1 family bicyclomycin/chloramphenicol resistance-like MFS transporter